MPKALKNSEKKYIDFMRFHKIFFLISIICLLLSIFSFIKKGLNFGIDFTGGVLFDVTVEDNSNIDLLREKLLKNNFVNFSVQSYEPNGIIIRLSKEEIDKRGNRNLEQKELIMFVKELIEPFFEKIEYNKIDFVGPQVGKDLIYKGIYSLLLSFLAILCYIAFRFELKFGIGAIASLVHDTIIIFGIYSIFNINFDLLSITAILTIIGYSVNDTVVIYDKLREFTKKQNKKDSLMEVINISLTTTLRRTILTSSTTLVSLLILSIFGGDAIKMFSFIVFLGIVIGTYSSIFISTPILFYLDIDKN